MPDDWIPNCGTQVERAIRALFVARGAATVADCFISNESALRDASVSPLSTGITTIRANASSTADGELSGNEKFTVSIQNKFGVKGDPTEENPLVNRTELDQRVGRQQLAMLRGNDSESLSLTRDDLTTYGRELADTDPDNEADMEEFTCLFVRYLGMTRGEPEDDSCSWVEVRNFEIAACPTAIT